jgi:hypothetical protein
MTETFFLAQIGKKRTFPHSQALRASPIDANTTNGLGKSGSFGTKLFDVGCLEWAKHGDNGLPERVNDNETSGMII